MHVAITQRHADATVTVAQHALKVAAADAERLLQEYREASELVRQCTEDLNRARVAASVTIG